MNISEFPYDDRSIIVATWRAVNHSFDHAFGREERWRAEVVKIETWAYIGGHELELAAHAEKTAPKVYEAMLAFAEERAQRELERGEAV